MVNSGPLSGIRVVDFSTLIPGPLASLILAEAGAEVTKIERRGGGDDLRGYDPFVEGTSLLFGLLNAGKQSRFLDLKQPEDRAAVLALIDEADVVVEQFRPGAMARLGLDYETLAARNPRLIYCSITAYGQSGARATAAAHDINVLAETGVLSQVTDKEGTPALTPLPWGDFAGGTYPALINILLALRERDRTGHGCHLDIAMADSLFGLMLRPIAAAMTGSTIAPNADLITGGSPRYAIYRTRDGRHIAVGALEDKFWATFCGLAGIELAAGKAEVAAALAGRDAADWLERFEGHDVCCSLVRTTDEALADPGFRARGLFARTMRIGSTQVMALPDPLAPQLRHADGPRRVPPGE